MTGIVIIAAGASIRMGSPKQLLVYNGKTLLRHAVDEAVNADAGNVVVVLGANAAACIHQTDGVNAFVVENETWETGMASSLIKGLKTVLQQQPAVDGVIFMVCDQPFVSSGLLNELIKKHNETGKPVVISNYGEAMGPPAFFHQSFFEQLMQLKGDEGAKKIVQGNKSEVASVLFLQGQADIDDAADYEKLLR